VASLDQHDAARLSPIRWLASGLLTAALVGTYCWFAVKAIPFFRTEPPSFVLLPMPVISGLVALLIYPSLQPSRSFFRRFIRLYLGFFITLVVYGCYLWWLIPDGNPWLIAGSLFTGHWLGMPPFLLIVAVYWLADQVSRRASV
jgi:hypothetical protein